MPSSFYHPSLFLLLRFGMGRLHIPPRASNGLLHPQNFRSLAPWQQLWQARRPCPRGGQSGIPPPPVLPAPSVRVHVFSLDTRAISASALHNLPLAAGAPPGNGDSSDLNRAPSPKQYLWA